MYCVSNDERIFEIAFLRVFDMVNKILLNPAWNWPHDLHIPYQIHTMFVCVYHRHFLVGSRYRFFFFFKFSDKSNLYADTNNSANKNKLVPFWCACVRACVSVHFCLLAILHQRVACSYASFHIYLYRMNLSSFLSEVRSIKLMLQKDLLTTSLQNLILIECVFSTGCSNIQSDRDGSMHNSILCSMTERWLGGFFMLRNFCLFDWLNSTRGNASVIFIWFVPLSLSLARTINPFQINFYNTDVLIFIFITLGCSAFTVYDVIQWEDY